MQDGAVSDGQDTWAVRHSSCAVGQYQNLCLVELDMLQSEYNLIYTHLRFVR